jgi:hypothetical protein
MSQIKGPLVVDITFQRQGWRAEDTLSSLPHIGCWSEEPHTTPSPSSPPVEIHFHVAYLDALNDGAASRSYSTMAKPPRKSGPVQIAYKNFEFLTGACQEQAAPVPHATDAYFRGEKLAGTRILLYWLTIIAWALGRNA